MPPTTGSIKQSTEHTIKQNTIIQGTFETFGHVWVTFVNTMYNVWVTLKRKGLHVGNILNNNAFVGNLVNK